MLLSQEERGQAVGQEKTANVCHIDGGIVKPFKKNKVNQYLLIWSSLQAKLEESKMQKSSRVYVHLWPPKDAYVFMYACVRVCFYRHEDFCENIQETVSGYLSLYSGTGGHGTLFVFCPSEFLAEYVYTFIKYQLTRPHL